VRELSRRKAAIRTDRLGSTPARALAPWARLCGIGAVKHRVMRRSVPASEALSGRAKLRLRGDLIQEIASAPAMNVSANVADFTYRAFIAYSHHDEAWATWLHKALETYRVPARLVGTESAVGAIPPRLAPIFRDRSELPSASDLSQTINEALRRSANLIVICSPHSASSQYVNEEISNFKRLGRVERIFCLIVNGEPYASALAGHEGEECFPPALRFKFGPDGEPTQERAAPLAADARAGKDGKSTARLKLIAGMLGIGFDALKQREHQRHMRRMVAVTSLSVIAMLITTGLAIDAVLSRRTAVVAQRAAQRRQKQAEDLVEFMLGDLNDKLSQVQRLDILEATDNQAMKYFQSLPTSDVTDQALALRAKALEKIGNIRESQGKLPEALESYRAASALTRDLANRAPADSARQVAFANSFNWIGNAYWFQGDLGQSLQNFQRAIELLEKEAAGRPQDAEVAASLASARTNAGRVLEARGDFAQAKNLYGLVQQTFEVLRTAAPKNARWQSELGYAYDNLGKVALEQGQLVQAIDAYHNDQRIKAELAAQDPKNYDAQEDLLIADAILGRTLALCGASEPAEHYARAAVSLAQGLLAFDSAQTYWREDLAYYSQLLGNMLRQDGRLDEAARLDSNAVRGLDELVTTDRTNARWRRELALAQLEDARLQVARHDFAAAKHQLGSALATIQAGRATTPGDVSLIVLAAQADIVAGRIAARRQDASASRDYWIRARDAIMPIARMGDDPNVLAALASALLLLNDLKAAHPVVQKLAAMGYRTPDFDALLAAKKIPYPVDTDVLRRITNGYSVETYHKVE
jgi:eukaryotic-like serine/threonine-protein kinase